MTTGSGTTTYAYDPSNLRYKKTSAAQTVQYQYDASGQVISESNGNNAITVNYIRGDRLLAKKDAATNQIYYYLYNGHGDVVQIVDTNGNVVNQYQYDEWGNIVNQSEAIANSFKYAGEQYDSESGLYYLKARYYDPSVGRFINEDTYEGQINNPLSLNLYTYVSNNPLTHWDPSGFSAENAQWSANEYSYLSNMAKNDPNNGNRIWAQQQLDANNVYIDPGEPGKVYTNDVVWAAKNPTIDTTTQNAPTPQVQAPSTTNGSTLNVTPLNQKDILPIRDGCFATSVAMVINYETGSNLTVSGTYNKYNKSAGLSWAVFSDNNVTQTRVSTNQANTIDAINTNYSNNIPTIVSFPNHYVVAISSGTNTSDIITIDPWGGTEISLERAVNIYGPINGYRTITPN